MEAGNDGLIAFPVSSGQRRIWFLEHLQSDVSAYNISLALRLKGRLDIGALNRSFEDIVNRHEILRTNFLETGSALQQVITPENRFALKQVGVPDAAAKSEKDILTIAAAETRRAFDLQKDFLLRAILMKEAPDSHILALSVQHIIFDGWSVEVLLQELKTLYGGYIQGARQILPDLPIQYADFTVWQNEWLESDNCRQQLDYWKDTLAGTVAPTELPASKPRPAVQTFNGAKVPIVIAYDIYKPLRELGRKENCTVFMVILAALKILIYRYSGQEDIVVGSPFSIRSKAGLENMIGFLLNTVVLRTSLEGNPDVLEILNRVRQTTLESYNNQDVPFETLVEALLPERDTSRNALFQIMLQISPAFTPDFEGLEADVLDIDNGTSQVDVAMHLWDDGEKLKGFIEYNTDLFYDDYIVRFVGHFESILKSIVKNPAEKIAALDMLTKKESHQIISDWNRTGLDRPETTFTDLFAVQARRAPTHTAVKFEGEQLTYRELDEQSNRLANYLRSLGIGPEVLVGICMERSLSMMAGLLGVLKAGGAYVPMDPGFPRDRLEFMLEDAGIAFLLTQAKLLEIFPGYKGKKVCMDSGEDPEIIASQSAERPELTLNPRHLAYVIYTSGSTGKPKGVEIEHRALANFLQSMQLSPGLGDSDILLSVTTLSFDIAALELYLPLITGATVVLASREKSMDGHQLIREINTHGVTVMQATPATWRLMIEAGWNTPLPLTMLCGGEALTADLAGQLLARGTSLWNMYGPTETTIWSTIKEITEKEAPVLIGRPIHNTATYILDKFGNAVPAGIPGELHIGGKGVARGYLNRPGLTVKKFIPAPFQSAGKEQVKVFKTGDLARFNANGEIECLGRLDEQVKVRGYRIEPGEIASALQTNPAVDKAIVALREDEMQNPELVGYIIPHKGMAPEPGELKNHLGSILPAYMVPRFYVTLKEFPQTPNGKIDRKALPAPGFSTENAQAPDYTPSCDELEIQLTIIWERLLKVKPIGIRDNFFDLGGHSLLATQLFARIKEKFKKNIPLATLFQSPTIAQLAEILRQKDWKPTWSSLVPIQPRGTNPPLFLIHGAEGNVLLYKELVAHLGSDQPVYGIQSRGLQDDKELLNSFEEMATEYINELQSLEPEGPYYLGGYCLGGAIAFEMARQLQKKGQEVRLLAMFESYNINGHKRPPGYCKYYHKLQNLQFHLYNLFIAKLRDKSRFLKNKAGVELSRLKIKLEIAGSAFIQKMKGKTARHYPHLLVTQKNDAAQEKYFPGVYEGSIILFKPETYFYGYKDAAFGWRSPAKEGVKIHHLNVRPRGMLFEPFVKEVAEILKTEIHEAATTATAGEEKLKHVQSR